MICSVCNKYLAECSCPDIDERLAKLTGYAVYRMCSLCGKHYARCKCEQPVWTTNEGDAYLPNEFRAKSITKSDLEDYGPETAGDK